MKRKLTRIIQKRGRCYVAYVKEVPGVNIQGRTLAEARRNLDDALALIVTVNRDLKSKHH
jgi:predicted RNase H-like HicB family nuclease